MSKHFDCNGTQKFFIPMVVDKNTVLPVGTKPEEIIPWKIGDKMVRVLLVEATEEQYHAYINPDGKDRKRKQRQMQKAEEKGERFAPPLSYESLVDEYGYDAEDTSEALDLALLRILFDQLVSLIEKKHPLYGPILRLTKEGKTQREIAEILGKSQSTIKEQQPAAIRLLRELYNS